MEAKIYPFNHNHDVYICLLEITKFVRNLIHPGRKIKAKFYKNTEQEYLFLESVYLNLKSYYYS